MHRRRHSSNRLLWLIVGFIGGDVLVIVLLFCLILLFLFVAVASKVGGSGNMSGGGEEGGSNITASHLWTGEGNKAVVAEALHVVSGLYFGPPDDFDTYYDYSLIPDVVRYWAQTCSGACAAAWSQGNVQCVMLITAAYGLALQPLPYVGNAITFWTSTAYLHRAGWEEVTNTGMPYPGDIVVMDSPYFGGVGHVGIIIDVSPPTTAKRGYVQFAEANGPERIVQMPLVVEPDGSLQMSIWKNYTIMGYIRHVADLSSFSSANLSDKPLISSVSLTPFIQERKEQ